MAAKRSLKIILSFALLGAVVALAVPILGQAFGVFPVWLLYVVLTLCPPSILLMATEACTGWLSWCSMQVLLLVVFTNAFFYGALAAVGLAVAAMVTRFRADSARQAP